jgi:hypothetical protein
VDLPAPARHGVTVRNTLAAARRIPRIDAEIRLSPLAARRLSAGHKGGEHFANFLKAEERSRMRPSP